MAMFDYDVPKIRDYWIDQVKIELGEAMSKFSKFNSNHEGYAVLKEEVDELWDNIKGNVAQELTRKEAVQRFIRHNKKGLSGPSGSDRSRT